MHIAEGILPLAHAAGWTAAAVPFVVDSALRLRREVDPVKRATTGMATAVLFAITLFPVPVPVIGATSHLCATPLLALLLGPRAIAGPACATLLLHALFFAHGGLTSLGANVFTLGVVGPWVAVGLCRGLGAVGAPRWLAVAFACGAADVAVYALDAAILGFAVAPDAPARAIAVVLLGFLPVQGPLAFVEGAASAWVFTALAARRPDFVPRYLVTLLAACLLFASVPAVASDWVGIDDSVMGRVASDAGRSPVVLFEWPGDLRLSVWLLGGLVAGFVVGRGVERHLGAEPRRAP